MATDRSDTLLNVDLSRFFETMWTSGAGRGWTAHWEEGEDFVLFRDGEGAIKFLMPHEDFLAWAAT